MAFTTYADFQNREVSEKIGMCVFEASKRLMGWVLHSGSVYKLTSFQHSVIVSLEESGAAYASVTSVAGMSASTYYLDRQNRTLYAQTSDGTNPNGKFMGLTFKIFFADVSVKAPWDLNTGFEVDWEPLLKDASDFGVTLDNQYQLGFAIEGQGNISFFNKQDFWSPIFDKYYWENQKVLVYSWNRYLPITEAKLIYRGRVQTKEYDPQVVKFTLKDFLSELKSTVSVPLLSAIVGARIPDGLTQAYQRKIYGYVYSHRPVSIDQSLDAYPITGTMTATFGSAIVTGSGTKFLTELSPDDEITIGVDTDSVSIQSVDSDTQITLSSTYDKNTQTGVTASIKPKDPKRYMNRSLVIAGHALREPTTTVTKFISLSTLQLADTTDLQAGDPLYINSENTTIKRISGNLVKLTTNLVTFVPIGTAVTRPAVTSVKINNRSLINNRDYTYNASTGRLTLDKLAEFNVAPELSLTGTLAFTSASRTVTGTGTQFRTEILPNAWVRLIGQADYFEVLSVDSDTQLTLRSAATYTGSGASLLKEPEIYNADTVIVTCDVLGATDNGASSGTFLKSGPQIVQQLLIDAGFATEIATATFTTANDLAPYKLGFVIPSTFDATNLPTVRDVINNINESIFGALIQNNDFQLEYDVLHPDRAQGATLRLTEQDIIKFSITSDSNRIAKTVTFNYLTKEYDPLSKGTSFQTQTFTSPYAQYLARTDNEKVIDSIITASGDAYILAARWALILEVASSIIEFNTKLQAARLQVNSKVDISHEKLYQRVGSSSTRKLAGVQSAIKTTKDCTIQIEDLANAFSRCAAICDNAAPTFTNATAKDRIYGGWITDTYGMEANDPDTFGINLIF